MSFNENYYLEIIKSRKLNKEQLSYYKRLARENGFNKLLAEIEGIKTPKKSNSNGRKAISQEVVRVGDYFVKKLAAEEFGWTTEADIPFSHKELYEILKPYAFNGDLKILKSQFRQSVSLKSRKYGNSIVVAKRYRDTDEYVFHNWNIENLAPAYRQLWADNSVDGILHQQTGPGGQYLACVYLPDIETVKKMLTA